jgi:hypothetical protein
MAHLLVWASYIDNTNPVLWADRFAIAVWS